MTMVDAEDRGVPEEVQGEELVDAFIDQGIAILRDSGDAEFDSNGGLPGGTRYDLDWDRARKYLRVVKTRDDGTEWIFERHGNESTFKTYNSETGIYDYEVTGDLALSEGETLLSQLRLDRR